MTLLSELPSSSVPMPSPGATPLPPAGPDVDEWPFADLLNRPLWSDLEWWRTTMAEGEVSLLEGIDLKLEFPDEVSALTSAIEDLKDFCDQGALPWGRGLGVRFSLDKSLTRESYAIVVSAGEVAVFVADLEAARRAIFFLQDELVRNGGPFLKLGSVSRKAVVQTRISRCFFGPIHRPPRNRDELLDDLNYYPEGYLNRLAHDGVNGLWISGTLSELCRSELDIEHDPNREKRLAKLRKTVEKCARYGIRIFLYMNEPQALAVESPLARAYPVLLGSRYYTDSHRHFCPSSPTASGYLQELFFNLFSDVPGLGGIINITCGEGGSHCYSTLTTELTCPRCTQREPTDVVAEMLGAMERGMHAANPEALLIAWPYEQYSLWGEEATVDAAGKLPPGVILQQNFESGGSAQQCGREHHLMDYWLSYAGPSSVFSRAAEMARQNGTPMSAKLQVGCSHEVATVPFVPVPGQLYRKYRAMHELGVSCVMQCWYFGNYPSLMTKAAGELAFAPLPATEDEFLLQLARTIGWGEQAQTVVTAWKHFQAGYQSFPLNHLFGWFGPVHDAPVWPLYLVPIDKGLAPSWQITPPGGDRVRECFANTHSLEEIVILTRCMAEEWAKGVRLLELASHSPAMSEKMREEEGDVSAALEIQMTSAANIMEFYLLRERLTSDDCEDALNILREMEKLVHNEIDLSQKLIILCTRDRRLGFHSEAEGYKYYPDKLRWRIDQLRRLLQEEFSSVESRLIANQALWPEYTGEAPQGRVYRCREFPEAPSEHPEDDFLWSEITPFPVTFHEVVGREPLEDEAAENLFATWKAGFYQEHLYLYIRSTFADSNYDDMGFRDLVQITVEPSRFTPAHIYRVFKTGESEAQKYPSIDPIPWRTSVWRNRNTWSVLAVIPFTTLSKEKLPERPIRFNIERHMERRGEVFVYRWLKMVREACPYPGIPSKYHFAWLLFEPLTPSNPR